MAKTSEQTKPKLQWCDHNLTELHKLAVEDPDRFEQLRKSHDAALAPALKTESHHRVSDALREGRLTAKDAEEARAAIERGDVLGLTKLLGEHNQAAPSEATKLAVRLSRKDLGWLDLSADERAELYQRDPKKYQALKAGHDFRPATATKLR